MLTVPASVITKVCSKFVADEFIASVSGTVGISIRKVETSQSAFAIVSVVVLLLAFADIAKVFCPDV